MSKAVLTQTLAVAALLVSACVPAPPPSATLTPTASSSEEAEIKTFVEGFGKRLQTVSLQSPQASEEIRRQYAGFVSSELLQTWMSDPSQAPGRIVSSPWPDRIEITSLTKVTPHGYSVTGRIVEVTSMEVVRGGIAGEIPIRLIVQTIQGHWVITEYAQGNRQQ